MEPTSSQGGIRSALRSKSSSNGNSALQSPPTREQLPNQPTHLHEWPSYEFGRGEDLRRQIRQKEEELENITKNKDRIRLRMQQNSKSSLANGPLTDSKSAEGVDPRYYVGQKSLSPPAHTRELPSASQASSIQLHQIQNLSRPMFTPSTPFQLSQNPLKSTIKPEFQNLNQSESNFTAHQNQLSTPSSTLRADNIQNLTQENQQLQRRLILVSSELDRVENERTEVQTHLDNINSQTDHLTTQVVFEEKDQSSHDHLNSTIQDERDLGKRLRDQLRDTEQFSKDTQQNLRALKNERNRTVQNCQDLSGGLNNKLTVMKELEGQQFYSQSKIDEIVKQINVLQRQLSQDHHNQHELASVIERLTNDRNELQDKLTQLNITYDQTVDEISRERAHIQFNNRRHLQLLASKVLYLSVEGMIMVRKQSVVSELFAYCKFDQHCHQTLKTYSGILEKFGQHQMKIAIKRWFQNVFKPIETRSTCVTLTDSLYKLRLRAKMFKKWRAQMSKRNGAYQSKIDAINKIWEIKATDVNKDVKRSLMIWRHQMKRDSNREQRLRLIIRRQESAIVKQALVLLKDYVCQFDYAIRQHVLTTTFSEKQHLLIGFNQLRQRVAFKKRVRLMKLAHLVKAWKDSIAYRRYMMAQNVLAQHLKKNCQTRLVTGCFHSLRHHKENEKFTLLNDKLHLKFDPAITQLTDNVNSHSEKALRERKLRALRTLSKQGVAMLHSYWEHWLCVLKGNQYKGRKNVKDIMIRRYKQLVHTALSVWRHGNQDKKIKVQLNQVTLLRCDASDLITEVEMVSSHVDKELVRLEKCSKSSFSRASKIWLKRMQINGLRTWQERCLKLKAMEVDGSGVIIKILRKNYISQAFSIYKQATGMIRQDLRNEKRADHYLKTRQARLVRKVYNAICFYIHNFSKAKMNFQGLVRNMDIWLERRTYLRWLDRGNLKVSQKAQETQNHQTLKFDRLNQDLGKVVKCQTQASDCNHKLNRKLIEQGNRVLSNYFARFYYVKASRGIKKWTDYVSFQKHRERYLSEILHQLRKDQFYFVKAAFQNWIAQAKQQEITATITHTVTLSEDEKRLTEHKRVVHSILVAQITEEIRKKQVESQFNHQQFNKVIVRIINKNDVCNYQSKKRFVLNQWRSFTKRQKQFVHTTINVLTKSLYQSGFTNLVQFSREKERMRVQKRVLGDGMRRMYSKKACGFYFSRWRETRYGIETERQEQVKEIMAVDTGIHEKYVERTKEWTGIKGLKSKQRIDLSNHLRAWRNVTMWQRCQRVQTQSQQQILLNWNAFRALKKWRQRQEITQKYRKALEKFRHRRKIIYLQACFFGFRALQGYQRNFMTKLHDVAFKFDHLMKLIAMKRIKNFANIRRQANRESKLIAAKNLESVLGQMHQRKLLQHLSELRINVQRQKARNLTIGSMFGHWFGRGLRQAFQKWKNQAERIATAEEINESGPVVEEVLHHQLRYENMRHLLRDEGYTPLEIQRVTVWASGRGRELIAKSIARMRHYTKTDDLYLKPKMFDRWRMFVQMRKLIRYLLRNMENGLQPVRSDLASAFNRWRSHMSTFKKYGRYRKDLVDQCARNNKHSQNLVIVLDQAEDFREQMQLQRDELVDKYMKSQRLAIAIGRDNVERGQTKGLNKLSDHTWACKKRDLEVVLQRNIDFIIQLKDKIKEFEQDNDSVAFENEELRQFSLNGYQIAKNVQSLQKEREHLSVDLADKACTIKSLLNQNESLSHKLHHLQQYHLSGNTTQQEWNQRATTTSNY